MGWTGPPPKCADVLRRKGFEVVAVGNADRFDYPATTVIPHRGGPDSAEQVANVLGGRCRPCRRDPFRSAHRTPT